MDELLLKMGAHMGECIIQVFCKGVIFFNGQNACSFADKTLREHAQARA